jgi:hypothetical protein
VRICVYLWLFSAFREIRGSISLVAAGRAGHIVPFCGKSSQMLFNAQLTRHAGGSQSSPIKPNPRIYYESTSRKEPNEGLECWSIGVMECWSIGEMVKFSHPSLHHSINPAPLFSGCRHPNQPLKRREMNAKINVD